MRALIKFSSLLLIPLICTSCIYLTAKEGIKVSKPPFDEEVLSFKSRVKAHYDSLSKLQKIGNGVFDDAYLEKNIRIIYDSIPADSAKFIEIGEVSGKAHLSDKEWLLYKIKKAALMEGANSILYLRSEEYDNRGSFWRILTGKNKDPNDPPIVYINYFGKAVFIKK